MNIHTIFSLVSPWFRKRRFTRFNRHIQPGESDAILDVGGYPGTWTMFAPCGKKIDILNVHEVAYDGAEFPQHPLRMVVGDGCSLSAADQAYEVVFSNSVIEHVGSWERQQAFAAEVRRAGDRLWVQTPAYEFFIEPHYIAPFVHWYPVPMRKIVARYFTPWGWMVKPTQQQVDERMDEIRLITYKEMKELFPDCEILRERFLGLFTKSYIAFRDKQAGA